MVGTLEHERGTWETLLRGLSVCRHRQLTTIDVLDGGGLHPDDPVLPLESACYDARADVVVVVLEAGRPGRETTLRHVIHGPVQVDLVEQRVDLVVLRVIDTDDVHTLIALVPATGPVG